MTEKPGRAAPARRRNESSSAPKKRTTLRDEQRLLTRRILVEAGLTVFGEKGYAATTVDDIVAAAQVSRATFYLHFDTKSSLLVEAARDVREWAPQLYGELDGIGEVSRSRIEKMVAALFDNWRDNARLLTALIQAEALEPDTFGDLLPSMGETVDRAFPQHLSRFRGRTREIVHTELTMLVVLTYRYLYYAFGNRPFPVDTRIPRAAMTDLLGATLNSRRAEAS